VEYILVELDKENKECRVSVRAEEILVLLQVEADEHGNNGSDCECENLDENIKFTASWHPEYGRYMIEGVPTRPYKHNITDLLCVERDMIARRRQVSKYLRPNERLLTIGNFPRLGCRDSFTQLTEHTNDASESLFFPDEFISSHARFKFYRSLAH
jgi:glutamate--cysteine ligase catalytic subunit